MHILWSCVDTARTRRTIKELNLCEQRLACIGSRVSELVERGPVLHVLFVCTGNICRSPIAERLATAYASQRKIFDFTASSAGTRAVIAHPIHHLASAVIEAYGGNVSDFSSRQFTSKIAADADLVLAMTRAHRDAVLELAPRQLHRTFTLAEASSLASRRDARSIADLASLRPTVSGCELAEIDDPIGQDPDFFARIGSQISALLPPIIELCRHESAI